LLEIKPFAYFLNLLEFKICSKAEKEKNRKKKDVKTGNRKPQPKRKNQVGHQVLGPAHLCPRAHGRGLICPANGRDIGKT
jgi:hypothetical protein